ncbi:hypothetical protein [Lacinutrix mariniflava]|uniref:hypothetical protein n=1 Tax=Lacinutrix mariniflava TaxID=342955 RepID=UPI0006E2107E|nr:hypothetical protein [Lacinutrix mariniflava]
MSSVLKSHGSVGSVGSSPSGGVNSSPFDTPSPSQSAVKSDKQSVIVIVPLGSVFVVLPLVTVPSTVNTSSPSASVSIDIGITTSTLVSPAGIITVIIVSV